MENASKALIIAGAILLAILIIGLGMGIYSSAKDAISGANLNQETIDAFNSRFDTYIGNNKKGTNIRTLCNNVRNNNLNADDSETFPITITGHDGKDYTEATEIDTYRATVKSGKLYNVSVEYSTTTKLIEKVIIEEVK